MSHVLHHGAGALLVGLAVIATAACDQIQPIDPEQPCLEAGYAIASRTHDCTGDAELANERYRAFEEQFDCIPRDVETDPFADLFRCSLILSQQTCAKTDELADELDAWLALSPACGLVIQNADGTPLDAGGGGT